MASGPLTPARFVLADVPKVGFYSGGPRCPEDFPWPACLRAALEYLGDSFGCRTLGQCGGEWKTSCSYALLMAVSGDAFRLTWKPSGPGDAPAVVRRTLDAIGYDYDLADKAQGREHLLARIATSLQRGVPVIARGVAGPPEACLVTGYDEGGDVLTGWSFFQDLPPFRAGLEFEPSGSFRQRDWFTGFRDAVILGPRRARPEMKRVLRDTLAWAIEHSSAPAYEAWAADLLRDDEPAAADSFEEHDDAVGMVAEGRWYASVFLADMCHFADRIASHLLAAAGCYAREHELMWDVWACVGGIGREPEKARRFADPAVRRRIVPIIREAGARDGEAAGQLCRALATLN